MYAVGHPILTPNGRRLAAVLACGDGAALSHRSAAALHGFASDDDGGPMHVSVRNRSGRRRPGVVIHRPRTLFADEVTRVSVIPVTTAERTLLDLAEVVPRRQLERACDNAERQRSIDWTTMRLLLERHPGRGGARRLQRLLGAHVPGEDRTRSELERSFLALCAAAHGLPRPEVNQVVAGIEVDATWPAVRLAVELDTPAFHATRVAFERDRSRDADLLVAGWRVLRVTGRRVDHEPAAVAAQLRELLGAA